MTRASTAALASQFSLHALPPDSLAAFYDEALLTLGTFPQIYDAILQDVALTDNATFTLPENHHTLKHVWYGPRHLDLMSHHHLLAHSPSWQDHKGSPVAYTREHLSTNDYRLYPAPVQASNPIPFTPGGAFGQGFPGHFVTLLSTVTTEDLPSWLDLPLALLVLHREYSRESPHMDLTYAQGCQQLAHFFMGMLAIPHVE